MACGNCTDKTFRVRVSCTSCGTVGGCSCPNAPSQLCLTLTGANLTNSACNSLFNGIKVTMTLTDNDSFYCCNPFEAIGVLPPKVYVGSFEVRFTPYATVIYQIVIGCCGPAFYAKLGKVSCVGDCAFIDLNPTCPLFGVAGFADLDSPCGGGLGSSNPVETCSPYSITGTFVMTDYTFTSKGTLSFNAVPVPPEGCGGGTTTGTCCDNELGTHPNLSIALTCTCSNIAPASGTYTAVWNGSAWQFGPTGTDNYIWRLYCPAGGTNGWQLLGTANGGSSAVGFQAVGSCNPANVVFERNGFANPNGLGTCNIKVSVTL